MVIRNPLVDLTEFTQQKQYIPKLIPDFVKAGRSIQTKIETCVLTKTALPKKEKLLHSALNCVREGRSYHHGFPIHRLFIRRVLLYAPD